MSGQDDIVKISELVEGICSSAGILEEHSLRQAKRIEELQNEIWRLKRRLMGSSAGETEAHITKLEQRIKELEAQEMVPEGFYFRADAKADKLEKELAEAKRHRRNLIEANDRMAEMLWGEKDDV